MRNWKKGVVLTTDREGLPGQIHCAECCGVISPGTKFYIEDYVVDYCCLNTRFFHFNCVQTVENRVASDSELAEIKEELAGVLIQKGAAEEEMALAEAEFFQVERDERALREKIGKLVERKGEICESFL